MHDCNYKTIPHIQVEMIGSEKLDLDFNCLAYASRRSARAVTNFFNTRMASLDLNVAQFGLLAAVAKMPGSSLSAIGEAMLIEESTMARNLAVLERRGLVEAQGGRGRSGKRVSLTKDGKALHAKGAKIWLETNRMLAAELSPAHSEAGRQFLRGLAAASEKLRLMQFEKQSEPVAS